MKKLPKFSHDLVHSKGRRYERVIDPIFTEDVEVRDFWLRLMAWVMAGHIEDKQWMAMLGERNSGKSVLIELFEACFDDYVKITSGNNFIAKRGSSDDALDMKWAVNLDMARCVFTSEIKMKGDKRLEMDGETLKKLGSGGDTVVCRGLYEKQVEFKMQCQFHMMLNDMPECTDQEAFKNCHEFHMKSEFVSGEPTDNGIVKQYKADDTIKDYVRSEKCVKAFTKVLFDHYRTEKPKVPKCIEKNREANEEDNELTKFLQMFKFTKNLDHMVSVGEFNMLCGQHLTNVSKKKIKIWLEQKGVNTKGVARTIKGIDEQAKRKKCYLGVLVQYDVLDELNGVHNDSESVGGSDVEHETSAQSKNDLDA